MYCILIKDEKGEISFVSIGNNPKVYNSEREARYDIVELINKEKELFGDVKTHYIITPYKERGISGKKKSVRNDRKCVQRK